MSGLLEEIAVFKRAQKVSARSTLTQLARGLADIRFSAGSTQESETSAVLNLLQKAEETYETLCQIDVPVEHQDSHEALLGGFALYFDVLEDLLNCLRGPELEELPAILEDINSLDEFMNEHMDRAEAPSNIEALL